MRKIIYFLLIFLCSRNGYGQGVVSVILDRKHLTTVLENGAARTAAELTHNSYLGTIHDRLDDINFNVSAVVLVQDMIHRSLTEVDQALRTGLTVRQIAQISTEIVAECNAMIQTAKEDPHLLLFAEEIALQLKNRGVNLVAEVSSFVLKEGQNLLMDYSKRDQLLRKIVLELQVMRALAYSMHKSMYWAKLRGVFRTLNPYSQFINTDKRIIENIRYNINQLKN
ncbi:hypothetical protein [Sphingobacterium bovistauri]|uniref:Plasmid transfer protein n=1 Tax=Sphingobacterium bovistauri TaxID=2781959 RepID=A0ABS7Z7J0_9SPHI|nr:hypothetical protein [Sphingobacterium bovistauri]MCA5006148.1 hypothetical protein [Sphingobacterium bovistauri]